VTEEQRREEVEAAHLLVGLTAAEAKQQQVTVGVGAGEVLAVGGELAVKDGPVALAFDLDTWHHHHHHHYHQHSKHSQSEGFRTTNLIS